MTKELTPHQDMFGAILEVTGWVVPAVPAGRVGKLATALLASGATAADIRERFGTADPGNGWWWRRDTWQGRAGNDPNERDLRENCGRWQRAVAVQLPTPKAEPAGFAALREWLTYHDEPEAQRFAATLAQAYAARPKETPPLATIEMYYRQCAFLPEPVFVAAVELVLSSKTYGVPQPGDINDAAVQVVMEQQDLSEGWARQAVTDWRREWLKAREALALAAGQAQLTAPAEAGQ